MTTRKLRLAGVIAIATLGALPLARGTGQILPPAPYALVATGQRFVALQEAVNAIGTGTGTIQIASGIHHDCAVQAAGEVAFVAEVAGQALFDGGICEGKATLVLRGTGARVEGLIFQNQRVPEGNGAGIRLEHGDLVVRQAWFRDSDEGILSGDDPAASVRIDQSTFSRLGRCDRGLACAHSVYFGQVDSVTIRRSRFEAGRGGHYVKSRAARIEVSDSSFDDAQGADTNYMIDLPYGATGLIAGNWMVQGRDKDNASAFITNAPEGHLHSADGLQIVGNVARLAAGVHRTSAFVADWSGDSIALSNNVIGPGLRRYDRR